MDIKEQKYKAVDEFLTEMAKNRKSNVTCPICNKNLKFKGNSSAYSVSCETPNCLQEDFRGI